MNFNICLLLPKLITENLLFAGIEVNKKNHNFSNQTYANTTGSLIKLIQNKGDCLKSCCTI